VLRPLSEKDGNRYERYDDWRGFGKKCLSTARRVDDRAGSVPKEIIEAGVDYGMARPSEDIEYDVCWFPRAK
jgi:hypothetical protein